MKRTWITILGIISDLIRIVLNKVDRPKKDGDSVG